MKVEALCKCDILSGRGNDAKYHAGNKTYRKIVDEYKCDYQRTTENSQKTLLAKKVIKKLDPKARFLKRSGDTWCVMNEREILKKIKQALREKDLWSKVIDKIKPIENESDILSNFSDISRTPSIIDNDTFKEGTIKEGENDKYCVIHRALLKMITTRQRQGETGISDCSPISRDGCKGTREQRAKDMREYYAVKLKGLWSFFANAKIFHGSKKHDDSYTLDEKKSDILAHKQSTEKERREKKRRNDVNETVSSHDDTEDSEEMKITKATHKRWFSKRRNVVKKKVSSHDDMNIVKEKVSGHDYMNDGKEEASSHDAIQESEEVKLANVNLKLPVPISDYVRRSFLFTEPPNLFHESDKVDRIDVEV